MRIVAIRRQDFDGPKEALRKIRQALARRDWPQVTVENVEGMHEVYIEPADAGGPMR